ncbi:hypothetical protein AKJ16_DCAP16013 [Drosera capensis]
MAMAVRALLFVALFATYASMIFGQSTTATHYTEYISSACYGDTDEGTMIAARTDFYNNGAIVDSISPSNARA